VKKARRRRRSHILLLKDNEENYSNEDLKRDVLQQSLLNQTPTVQERHSLLNFAPQRTQCTDFAKGKTFSSQSAIHLPKSDDISVDLTLSYYHPWELMSPSFRKHKSSIFVKKEGVEVGGPFSIWNNIL
jgi:hypothetical protein